MEELVKVAKALADANRLKVLAFVQRYGEVCVCEVSESLGYSQPLASKYLAQLRDAGLLKSLKKGRWTLYSLRPSELMAPFLERLEDVALPPIIRCNRC